MASGDNATDQNRLSDFGIWGYAFGYFACYVPYSALTKALTKGLLGEMGGHGVNGFALLPSTTLASLAGMFTFLTAIGWWRYAGRRRVLGVSVPCPGLWTFLSGLCTAAIIGTTTLAYTFGGISIVFMVLLMKGGVLVIAPMVDALARRRVRWFSWVALALSLASLSVEMTRKAGFAMTAVAVADVTLYLLAYFIRLQFMSRLAKADDFGSRTRFFVEEQMVATPAIVTTLALCALWDGGPLSHHVREGFTAFWSGGHVAVALLIGVLSQGTGIFGGLILLDKRENTYCVPVNRASSVLAVLLAGMGLAAFLDQPPVNARELLGAALIIAAIGVLSIPPAIERRRAQAARTRAAA